MKPFQETWWRCNNELKLEDKDDYPLAVFDRRDGWDDDRAKLASKAPEMARMLLNLEWSADEDYMQSRCPSCEGWNPAVIKDGLGHHDDCELVALLVAAGVMK